MDYKKKFNEKYRNSRFWSRFERKPDLRNAKVLDLGCQTGSLCVDMALAGADKVVGIDLNSSSIHFAVRNLKENYSSLLNIIEFENMHLENYPHFLFDYIVSKDTLEHVHDLDRVLEEMKKRLNTGGELYLGFGPLWKSPFGGHHKGVKKYIPWMHLLLSSSLCRKVYSKKKRGHMYSNLNKLTFQEYERIFQKSDFSIEFIKINNSEKILSKMFSQFRRIPFLREYFTFNVYCILKKK